MNSPKQVITCGAFDDIRAPELRFLEEASKLGELTVLLWTDEEIRAATGQDPKFPLAERLYFLSAVRYVSQVLPVTPSAAGESPARLAGLTPEIWVAPAAARNQQHEGYCRDCGIEYRLLTEAELAGFPEPPPMPSVPGRRKVIATGCYDWFHSGHVRFAEEASFFGDLYIVVGHDANIRLLKGEGHPLLSQDERRYAVGSIKFVKQALISTGHGWLDAEPEIERLRPDAYIVNEDGDKGGKRDFCQQHGIEYIVLKRAPAPGLPRRSSTDLRGF
jgi:cytidyltransferase-like protein